MLFRERLSKNNLDGNIWKLIWKQFREKGITIKNGTKQDADNDIIKNYSTTTASVHDSQIDLSIPGIVATRIKVTLALKEEV